MVPCTIGVESAQHYIALNPEPVNYESFETVESERIWEIQAFGCAWYQGSILVQLTCLESGGPESGQAWASLVAFPADFLLTIGCSPIIFDYLSCASKHRYGPCEL